MSTATSHERPARTSAPGIGTALRVRIELWLAAVFMALAFVGGVTIGMLAEQRQQPVVGVAPVSQLPAGQFTSAPPLTDEQIQQGLPPGHPDLSSGSDASNADAGKASQQEQGGGKSDTGSNGGSNQGSP